MSAPTNIVGAAVAAAAAWTIVSHDGPIELLVFDIGANVPCSVLEDTAHKHFKIWEMACFGGFLNGREIAKRLVARGRGTLIFTGATKARRNAANFAAFSGAKPALRAHAQSMARDLEPQGIHVAHVVVGGAIDTEFSRSNFPERDALKHAGRHPEPRAHRRERLASAQAAARRVDVRAGPSPLHGALVMEPLDRRLRRRSTPEGVSDRST